MLATSTANMSTGVIAQYLLTLRAWTPGQQPTTLRCRMTQLPLSPMECRKLAFASAVLDLPLGCAKLVCFRDKFMMAALKETAVAKIGMHYGKLITGARFWSLQSEKRTVASAVREPVVCLHRTSKCCNIKASGWASWRNYWPWLNQNAA